MPPKVKLSLACKSAAGPGNALIHEQSPGFSWDYEVELKSGVGCAASFLDFVLLRKII